MSDDSEKLFKNIRSAHVLRGIFSQLEFSRERCLNIICTYIALDLHCDEIDEEDLRHMFILINQLKKELDVIANESENW